MADQFANTQVHGDQMMPTNEQLVEFLWGLAARTANGDKDTSNMMAVASLIAQIIRLREIEIAERIGREPNA